MSNNKLGLYKLYVGYTESRIQFERVEMFSLLGSVK